ncbi:MFS transporter [Curtobacterium sp. MCSS17_011]|uniref:MFS transporter n=1 Tax=Curtobacterium sp. MCSS17_011 TaxID=2175643 RepID=UPI001C64728C|nr:MFS transporter [Curtobacterium sp. MCSS17_011]
MTTDVSSRRWWLLAALALAQLMIALDTTVVTIALPSAQADLGFADSARQWIVTGYALAFGSLLLLSGRLADRWGRKRALLIGLAGFGIASAVGGAAPTVEMLVAARIGQGVFAALLAPAALALVSTTFTDPAERGRAFGVFGSVSMVGTTVGLLLGGVLTEVLSWRWTMFINTAIAIPALIGAALLVRNTSRTTAQRLDLGGAATITLGLFALVLGTSNAESAGWAHPLTLALLVVAAALLAVFVVVETRVSTPLLPMRVILERGRGSALVALVLSSAGLFTTFLFLPYYLQSTLGYSQVSTGLAFLPVPAALVVAAVFIGPALTRRIGARFVVPIGLTVAGVGALLLIRIGLHSAYAVHLLPSLILIGAGIGLVIATATGAATARLADADAGAAAATVNAAQQVGGSVGVAVLNTVAATAAATYLTAHPAAQAATQAASVVHSYTTAFGWVGAIFLAGAVATTLISPKDPAE